MLEALKPDDYLPLVKAALAEDIGSGDATTLALVPGDSFAMAVMVARDPLVMAGVDLALAAFQEVDERVEFGIEIFDGQLGGLGQALLRVQGPTRALLTAERTALNFVQRLAGVATLTARFVEQVAGTVAVVVPAARRSEVNAWLASWPEHAEHASGARAAVDSSVTPSGDDRVVVLERTNARHLTDAEIPEAPGIITCDVSFIGLETILPAALADAARRVEHDALRVAVTLGLHDHQHGVHVVARDLGHGRVGVRRHAPPTGNPYIDAILKAVLAMQAVQGDFSISATY